METQQNVWDAIAVSWHGFRQKPILLVESLAARWKPGKILDVGCGNGRNLLPFLKHGFRGTGVDFSKFMVKNAENLMKKNRVSGKVELKHADMDELPFEDESFDYVLSAASLHHVTKPVAYSAIGEMHRVLKKKGTALVVVWNKLQPRFLFSRKEVFVPWTVGNDTYQRYYYLYTKWELQRMLENSGFEVIESSPLFGRNLYFILRKAKDMAKAKAK